MRSFGKNFQLWVEGKNMKRIHHAPSSLSIYIPYPKNKKKGRMKVTDQKGKVKTIRVYKYLPKGCSTPKRICIKCLVVVIHKLDKNYDSKICKECGI